MWNYITVCLAIVFWYQAEILNYLDVTIPTGTKGFQPFNFQINVKN